MMNTPFHQHIDTRSADQTRCLGACLGRRLAHGTVIRLTGELGAGKTCFIQGLGRGLGVSEAYDITSPTYTLINEYPARLPFVHADLYRIASSLDADGIGLWDLCGPNAVVAVEWSDRLDDGEWPEESLCLAFHILDDLRRRITLIGCGLRSHDLIKQVVADFAVECANSLN
jgi:tRNA threonylcarbamoyladenosine biosynthesis protein TsaE